jgi:1,4-dihydroxy-2-naphthoate octaprenyltransferase
MALIYYAFTDTNYITLLFYLVLGILAIFSAICYTVGNTAYGYRLWRSICFIFFGLVSTLGVNFVFTNRRNTCFASCIGLLSVGVLNLNNMRDEASDKKKWVKYNQQNEVKSQKIPHYFYYQRHGYDSAFRNIKQF